MSISPPYRQSDNPLAVTPELLLELMNGGFVWRSGLIHWLKSDEVRPRPRPYTTGREKEQARLLRAKLRDLQSQRKLAAGIQSNGPANDHNYVHVWLPGKEELNGFVDWTSLPGTTDHRVYINCRPHQTVKIAERLVESFRESGTSSYFKYLQQGDNSSAPSSQIDQIVLFIEDALWQPTIDVVETVAEGIEHRPSMRQCQELWPGVDYIPDPVRLARGTDLHETPFFQAGRQLADCMIYAIETCAEEFPTEVRLIFRDTQFENVYPEFSHAVAALKSGEVKTFEEMHKALVGFPPLITEQLAAIFHRRVFEFLTDTQKQRVADFAFEVFNVAGGQYEAASLRTNRGSLLNCQFLKNRAAKRAVVIIENSSRPLPSIPPESVALQR